MAKPSPPTDMNSFLAGIGHVCLQWALLEHTILCLIGVIEAIPVEKAYTRFASLDMQPRLNMAIALAIEAKLHGSYIRRLRAIRTALQKEGKGLAEKRNMYVHGAHDPTEVEGEFALTMSRWKGDRRRQVVTILYVSDLVNRLSLLAQEGHSIFSDYGVRKHGAAAYQNTGEHVAQAKAALRFIRAKQIKRGLKLIFGNLKPI